jgi:hypothetical protein
VPDQPATTGKSLPALLSELRELVVAYARQETVEPFKQLGRYIGFGAAGSLLVGIGCIFVGVGVLRALQTETGTRFDGGWSWFPYVVAFLVLAAIGGMFALAATRKPKEKGP